ncbi:thiamine phosphate synthase [Aquimarina sp. 2-A2]|uniref:thiamine phosphate synthase n=1 Tax=Aquimarina sp. 2-A2 TaxID=3382644 RepID=UPI00387F1618
MHQLQYISQGLTPEDHLLNIERVCKAGVRWIQLRLKNVDLAIHLKTALQCRVLCDQFEAILIINDAVGIARASQADGVHLGTHDMTIKEARKILGNNAIIGGTANTAEDCIKLFEEKVDYVGLGPLRYTATKKDLSPVLGIMGYQEILDTIKHHKLKVPVVAIGGITENDVELLMKTGISGIAVSSLLTKGDSFDEKINALKNLIA